MSNLALRVISAAVMMPLALVIAYAGGVLFALFWAAAALAVLWEWSALVRGAALAPPARLGWYIAGAAYASVLLLAPLLLRADAAYGFLAIVMLFGIVWTTDVAAYFAGRALGGPKLMPSVSPKKTWSGAIGGTLGAMLVAVALAYAFGIANLPAIAVIALLLSVLSQIGDLLESWIKRRFGAKDAGQLIPGHGGVMDRLDGFWAAALAAALIGVVHGGFDAPARGLLIW
ncbi:MAG: CDP-archaeol synthase [Pseudolabrys sp.]|nr:CDP-archaeol synthase [Pseudolabrys sp.]